jgi:hypothetical protein
MLMLLFVGLALNVGWMAYVRSQGQAAVDPSALSGAAAIPDYNKGGSKLGQMVSAFNATNTVMNAGAGLTLSNVTLLSYPSDPSNSLPPNAIRVEKGFPTPLFLWRLFGKEFSTISVHAVGALLPPGGLKPELPIALMDCQVGYPQRCGVPQILDGFNTSPSPNDDSAFTSFLIKNASASEFKMMVEDPSTIPYVSVGMRIELNNGSVNSTLKAIEDKLKSKVSLWCNLVPVISCAGLNGNPNQQAAVAGFAQICLTKIKSQGNPKTITASLNCDVQASGTPGLGARFGLYADHPVIVE